MRQTDIDNNEFRALAKNFRLPLLRARGFPVTIFYPRGYIKRGSIVVAPKNEGKYPVTVKPKNAETEQKESDYTPPPRPRPLVAGLPDRLDEYEDSVARFFQWKTGLDYYYLMDKIIDFVISDGRNKIVDLLTDTAVFALRIAERKAFNGNVYSFDSNVTLLERAKQRAAQLNLQKTVEFKQFFHEGRLPLPNCFAEIAVSFFDLHRHTLKYYLPEILRILEPEGRFIIAALTEPKTAAPIRLWKWANLKYVKKNPTEADTVYPDREYLIKSLFGAGFRQVIIQEMNSPTTMRHGIFNMIAATK